MSREKRLEFIRKIQEARGSKEQTLKLSVSHINFELLFGKIASNWEITKPLLVKIEQEEDGSYLVSEDLFAVYGVGNTSYDALQDYMTSLVEYYNLLSARVADDVPTQALFRRLQQYLRKTDE